MDNKPNTYRVLTFCSNVNEKSDKISDKNKRDDRDKCAERGKSSQVNEVFKIMACEEKAKIGGNHYIKYTPDTINVTHRRYNNTSIKPKATILNYLEEGKQNSGVTHKQTSEKTLNGEDQICNKVITTEPKIEIPTGFGKQLVTPDLNDGVKKQLKKINPNSKVKNSRNRVAKEPPKAVTKNQFLNDEDKIQTKKLLRTIPVKEVKQFFKHHHRNNEKLELKESPVKVLNSATQNNAEADKMETKLGNIPKRMEDFYFNRNYTKDTRGHQQKRNNVKSTRKSCKKRKVCTTRKSRSIQLYKVPSKRPIRKVKSKPKIINLDYLRRKITFHISSSSSHIKQIVSKDNIKIKGEKHCKQKPQQNMNGDVKVLFSHTLNNSSNSRKKLPLYRSRSNDVFGFRRSNRSINPAVYWKFNKWKSYPHTIVGNCRYLEQNSSCPQRRCLLCAVKKATEILCKNENSPSQSIHNLPKTKRCDRQCEAVFKMIDFPSHESGDGIQVYRFDKNKTCQNARAAKKMHNISGDGLYKKYEDIDDNDKFENVQTATVHCDCNFQRETALIITIRSFLICTVILCWLPCILLIFLCWLITYPMRPHEHDSGAKKSLWNSFVDWVRSAKWFNLSFLHDNDCHKLERPTRKRSPQNRPVKKHPFVSAKTPSPLEGTSCAFPNKQRQYTLAHTTGRGWVMKPLRDERMPPSILKKDGQSSRLQGVRNFGQPCPPGLERTKLPCAPCIRRKLPPCVESVPPPTICLDPSKSIKPSKSIQVTTPSIKPSKPGICKCTPCKSSPSKSTLPRVTSPAPRKVIRSICECKLRRGTPFLKSYRDKWKSFMSCDKNAYFHASTCKALYTPPTQNTLKLSQLFRSMYRNCCHMCLLFASACVWIPCMICCHLCFRLICVCS